jgi:hypothetical protein
MTLSVIGAGVGRTGTYSLKLALEQLGCGPCHHMEEVIKDAPHHVPLWQAAVDGKPDWSMAYKGYNAAVDWPTAAFWRELADAYPKAKVILTVRSPESWHDSFSQTIDKLLRLDDTPPPMRPFLTMAGGVIRKTGFDVPGRDGLTGAFKAHWEAVVKHVPKDRLLVFEVKDGWQPLCAFLGKPVPDAPFPRSNSREDFWDRINKPPGH